MARTRMPPSGKMPVSTAALRTTATTVPMSTRPSRLAEYSIVKCGMAVSLPMGSGEIAAHRAVDSIVRLDCVALAGLDRTDEGAGEHDLAGLKCQPMRRNLVGEPRDCGSGMIEHAGGKPGLFQLAVLEAQRADPAQISIQRLDRTPAEHNTGIRGIIGDGVEDFSCRFGCGIDALDARIQDLQRRHDEVGR